MKNLHLIPTNKPSKLYKVNNNLYFEEYPDKTVNAGNQHIYITSSDEEIKDGEYGICLNLVREGFKSHQAVFKMDSEQRQAMEDLGGQKKAKVLKVILTTDQDLIADGVQAIDDEFLEWFIKNPSCESVVVNFNYKKFRWSELNKSQCYKIIIPQEEPKQETLEEAAANLADPNLCKTDNWIAGAKWQAERMYSEEEVRKIAEEVRWQVPATGNPREFTKNFDKWFEQFKKK
jgi:hypothetical protein